MQGSWGGRTPVERLEHFVYDIFVPGLRTPGRRVDEIPSIDALVPDTLEFFVKHARIASKSFNIVPRRTKISRDPHDRRESRMNLEAKKSRMNLEVKSSTGCF